ncbi:MAG: glutamate--tRNA ligase, partial [Ruminococcaceae bacterium]|nr:glutamate--tRNA ligase [Oscillospiraceae bacterium]
MDYKVLADLLFPNVTETPEEMEERFPHRNLPEGAKVTRLGPSPTGFMHFGTLFPAFVSERLAHLSGGVFFLRIEDTDAKREVEGAEKNLIDTLSYYQINFDEGATADGEKGDYGPYRQSERASVYHVFAKKLVEEGKAYPCFTTEDELRELNAADKKVEIKNKDWKSENENRRAQMLAQREFTIEDVEENIKEGNPFVLRILSSGDGEKKVFVTDLIKGKLELTENDEDFVLLKSDGIPTYHFAHAVDDHLMGTTHVVRGEEWLPSLPKHIQLFNYLGFKMPKYLHIAQLMKLEGASKKKFSKRDRGAAVSDYRVEGYPPETVIEYVMTLLNSNYEDWRRANPDESWTKFDFSVKKMSASGCLFDLDKLTDVSKNVISRMTAQQVCAGVTDWAKDYDTEFYTELSADREYAERIFAIGRGGAKPRKDLGLWKEAKAYMGFFYDKYYAVED